MRPVDAALRGAMTRRPHHRDDDHARGCVHPDRPSGHPHRRVPGVRPHARGHAVAISGVVALTLPPVMSAYLLRGGREERGLSGRINRFDRLNQGHLREAPRAVPGALTITVAWAVRGPARARDVLTQAPKELAPTEDQGYIFGILDTPSNSTLDQLAPLHPRGEQDGDVRSRSRTSRSRSPSRTEASGVPSSSRGRAPANGVRDPPGGQAEVADPHAQAVPDPPRRFPAAASSRSSSSSPRPPSCPIPELRAELQEGHGERDVRVPAAHRRQDRPALVRIEIVARRWRSWGSISAWWDRISDRRSGETTSPLQRRRPATR